jgi:protein TonB
MNMYARIAEHRMDEMRGAASAALPPVALSAFARLCAPRRSKKAHLAGTIGVVVVHAIVVSALVLAGAAVVTRVPPRLVTVVDLPPEQPKPLPPPPMPKFEPPPVYVPVAIVPDIQLEVPPPPRETVTLPPPPPAPAPPNAVLAPPPAAPAPSGDAQAAFAKKLFAHLNRFKRYPESAKLRHEQGVVSLRFTMDRSGHVLSFAVAKGSGSAALNGEALALIQRAQPLPAVPAEIRQDRLDLIVPVDFSLH